MSMYKLFILSNAWRCRPPRCAEKQEAPFLKGAGVAGRGFGRLFAVFGDLYGQDELLVGLLAVHADLNVAATDSYIDSLLDASEEEKREPKRTFIMKDVRVFVNTILHGLDLMKQGGIDAGTVAVIEQTDI